MNRWLMPCLVTGLVSTIALCTLSPLALSLKATAGPHATATRTTTTDIPQQQPRLLIKVPPPPQASTASKNRPAGGTATVQPSPRRPLAQLLSRRACFGSRAALVPLPAKPGTEQPDSTLVNPPPPLSDLASTLAQLINQQRQHYGITPLTVVPTLALAAYRHSVDMATQSTPAHQGSDGSSGGGRMLAAGYQWQAWAEVIGWGFTDPASMVAWWLNDAEHRAVLLSPAFTEFGIGYATIGDTPWQEYWTVNFGQPTVTNMSSPAATDGTARLAQAPPPASEEATSEEATSEEAASEEAQPVHNLTEANTACPLTTTQPYALIPMEGVDLSHPAPLHGDLNLARRGSIPIAAQTHLLDIAGPVDPDAPQLSQLFAANQPIQIRGVYQVADWQWACGDHGCRGAALTTPEVTLLGLASQPGMTLYAPARQASIYRDEAGNEYGAVVLYAENNRLTLAYTRDGSVANGYVVHLEQICVDPGLVQRYEEADRAGRQQLPALQQNQPLGTAAATEVQVAIRDRGAFLDPRSRKDWWRGY